MAHEKRDRFIKNPIFEGGKDGMTAFVQQHLRYPEEALLKKIEGTVFTHIDIDYKGRVTQVNVLKGLGFGCDEEAIRVIKLMRFKTEPPKGKGQRVVWHQKFNINFRLPNAAVPTIEATPIEATPVTETPNVAVQFNFNYNYIETPSSTENKNDTNQNNSGSSNVSGYNYTISL